MSLNPSLAVIGVGAMGQSLLAGWVAAGWQDIQVVDANPDQLAAVKQRYDVSAVSVAEVSAQIIVLAVKPAGVAAVLNQLRDQLGPDQVVVSIAAGVTLAQLAAEVPDRQPLIRVMPNTPALVGEAMSALMAGEHVTDEQLAQVQSLFDAVGETVVCSEDQVDTVIGLSGSGPAYLCYVAEAMIEAGVHLGLGRDAATKLVEQTFKGTGKMLAESEDSATVLREKVTSPGGTTAAALAKLDEHGVRSAFLQACRAAHDRSIEMSS